MSIFKSCKVLTEIGYRSISDFTWIDYPKEVNKSKYLWDGEIWVPTQSHQDYRYLEDRTVKETLLAITTSDGATIVCSGNQRIPIHVKNGSEFVKAEKLGTQISLLKPSYPIIEHGKKINEKIAYTAGFFSGDGSTESRSDNKSIWLYGPKRDLIEYFEYKIAIPCAGNKICIIIQPPEDPSNSENYTFNKVFVPDCTWNIKARLDWLAGLIDSDGGLNDKSGSIGISSVKYNFLLDTKLMLSTLGIWSTIGIANKAGKQMMPDGHGGHKEYDCQTAYKLIISAVGVVKLRELGINTHRVDVTIANPNRSASRFPTITNITPFVDTEWHLLWGPNLFAVRNSFDTYCCNGLILGTDTWRNPNV